MNQFKRTDADVPTWFFHLIYTINIVVLLMSGWWLTAAQWVLIWILSVVAEVRARLKFKKA